MTDSPETNDLLLARIGDPGDRDAWHDFVAIYRPLIYRIARRYGLQDADAQNVVQDVLHKVERQTASWDIGQPPGSFRRWLATVARNAAIDAIRRIRPDAAYGGSSVYERLHQVVERDDQSEKRLGREVQRELEREAFRQAARRIRDEFTESTWEAFWQTMVEGESCADVASRLGKSLGAIYTARSRVMQRLKEEVSNFHWTEGQQ